VSVEVLYRHLCSGIILSLHCFTPYVSHRCNKPMWMSPLLGSVLHPKPTSPVVERPRVAVCLSGGFVLGTVVDRSRKAVVLPYSLRRRAMHESLPVVERSRVAL